MFCICGNSLLSCVVDHFVFFFKQKTAYEMRISDWSSDVCSSDLVQAESIEIPEQQRQQNAFDDAREDRDRGDTVRHYLLVPRVLMEWLFQIGRASCREIVCQYV